MVVELILITETIMLHYYFLYNRSIWSLRDVICHVITWVNKSSIILQLKAIFCDHSVLKC